MELPGKLRRPHAVLAIVAVIIPASVMQEGKKHDHISPETGSGLAEVQSFFEHSGPMRGAVQSVPVEAILPPDLDQ